MKIQQEVERAVKLVIPFDELEKEHQSDILAWTQSGAQLTRISKPDNPSKHLVSYFLPYDEQNSSVMLIEHIKSGLWLPPGGHVDMHESPYDTVAREAREELNILPNFDTPFGDTPFFVTVNVTTGQNEHTDVSLWYVITGDSTQLLDFNRDEIKSYKWLTFSQALEADVTNLDRHMHRCINKMKTYLTAKK